MNSSEKEVTLILLLITWKHFLLSLIILIDYAVQQVN